MAATFWTNTVWYLLLGVITVAELIYVFYKAENKGFVFAFFATFLGVTLLIETVILVFLKSYTYYPRILLNARNPYDDVLAGNLFSQFIVTATILLAIVFNLKYHWYFILALAFGGIETLFLHLGIYVHNWYRTWMTVFGFPVLFFAAKWMYEKLRRGIRPFSYYLYIFVALFSLEIITLDWGLLVIGIHDYSGAYFHDPGASRTFWGICFYVIRAIALLVLYFAKPKWPVKVSLVGLLYAIYFVAVQTQLIQIRYGWFFFVPTATLLWMYGCIALLDFLYRRGPLRIVS